MILVKQAEIEFGAKALYEHTYSKNALPPVPFEQLAQSTRDFYIGQARIILQAVERLRTAV